MNKKKDKRFKNINNFINMILFTCDKLTFDYPLYSTLSQKFSINLLNEYTQNYTYCLNSAIIFVI